MEVFCSIFTKIIIFMDKEYNLERKVSIMVKFLEIIKAAIYALLTGCFVVFELMCIGKVIEYFHLI